VAAAEPCRWSVVLLHDQLQDARVWSGLVPLLASEAVVYTVSLPPLRTLGSAGTWSEHIGRYARATISPGAVDLVITIGGSGEAGIGLIRDQLAGRALLIDPDPLELIKDREYGTDTVEDRADQMLRTQAVADKLTRFFQQLEPALVEQLATHGVLPAEQIRALAEVSLPESEGLPADQLELLRRMMAEQLAEAMPLDVTARPAPERPGWVSQLAAVAALCTIVISPTELHRQVDFRAALARRVPGAEIVEFSSAEPAILRSPGEVDALARVILQR
jgi:hypothetical protein